MIYSKKQNNDLGAKKEINNYYRYLRTGDEKNNAYNKQESKKIIKLIFPYSLKNESKGCI